MFREVQPGFLEGCVPFALRQLLFALGKPLFARRWPLFAPRQPLSALKSSLPAECWSVLAEGLSGDCLVQVVEIACGDVRAAVLLSAAPAQLSVLLTCVCAQIAPRAYRERGNATHSTAK